MWCVGVSEEDTKDQALWKLMTRVVDDTEIFRREGGGEDEDIILSTHDYI